MPVSPSRNSAQDALQRAVAAKVFQGALIIVSCASSVPVVWQRQFGDFDGVSLVFGGLAASSATTAGTGTGAGAGAGAGAGTNPYTRAQASARKVTAVSLDGLTNGDAKKLVAMLQPRYKTLADAIVKFSNNLPSTIANVCALPFKQVTALIESGSGGGAQKSASNTVLGAAWDIAKKDSKVERLMKLCCACRVFVAWFLFVCAATTDRSVCGWGQASSPTTSRRKRRRTCSSTPGASARGTSGSPLQLLARCCQCCIRTGWSSA